MKKKGVELGIQTVVVAALGLIVLVILIIVIRQQIGAGAQRYTDISKEAEKQIIDRCEGFLSARTCEASCGDKTTVPAPSKGWQDCTQGQVCCE